MTISEINTSLVDDVAVVTINKPATLNVLTQETLEELDLAFTDLFRRSEVRCIILTGAGGKAFSAGGDVRAEVAMDHGTAFRFAQLGNSLMQGMLKGSKPIIAAVNGYALGGGAELALACDMRIASDNANFGLPEINLGIIPGFGGTCRLPRIVGAAKAKEIMMLGEMVDAEEGYRVGLYNKVVPLEELLPAAIAMGKALAAMSQPCVTAIKRLVDTSMDMDMDAALQMETANYSRLSANLDKREGMQAFIEKRKPVFMDR